MTGRPIDTSDLRERAQLRKAAACALCNEDVHTLCDALDAARAEIERVRTLLVLERRERPDKYGPDYRGDGSWEIAREALGEEKR